MKIAPTVPVTNNLPVIRTAPKVEAKSNSVQTKSKATPKKANSVKSEERLVSPSKFFMLPLTGIFKLLLHWLDIVTLAVWEGRSYCTLVV